MNAIQKTINVVVKFTQQGLDNINKQINKLNTNTTKFTKSTNDATKATKDLNKGLGDLGKNTKNTNKQTEGASKATRSFGASVGRAINIVAQFTIAMYAVQAVQKVFSFFTIDAARAAMEFESALKSLQAIADVSSEDLETFRKVIFDVAGSTRFTASEIAELQKELSRLGFTTKEVVDSTEAIARFAEAIGSDLGQAAQFVGKQLQAFGLNASSAFEVTNSFTALINNSALSMETLATSMQYASSIASTLGVSIDETGALLGVLTNNGITASRAGTGLRQIFLELGADGGTLLQTLGDLAEQNITLSEAEELVGKRAAGALSVLIDQREEVERLVDAQENLVAATIASARQNSTFEGQVTGLSAAVDKLLIRLGSWITKTGIVLRLIESLGGGTTYRAFNVIDEIGLSSEELKAATDNIGELEKGLISSFDYGTKKWTKLADKNVIAEALGVSAERAEELSENFTNLMRKDGKNIQAFTDYLKDMKQEVDSVNESTQYAEESTSEYKDRVDEIADSARKGIEIDAQRDELLTKISDKRKLLKEQLETSGKLSEQETRNIEKESELLSQLEKRLRNISVEREKETKEKEKEVRTTEKLVEEFISLNEQLERANKLGDEVGLKKITKSLKEIADEVERTNRGKEFLNVYEAMLGEREKEKNQKRLEDARKEMERVNKEADNYLKRQDKLNDAVGELGLIGKLLYGSGHKKAGESEEEFIERIKSVEDELQKATLKVAEAGIDAALDATQRRLEAEQEAVDARYSYEEDRLQSLLQSNLITQAEYERKREQLERERIEKSNEIDKKQFEADKTRAIVDIAISTAKAVAEFGFVTPQALIAIAAGAVQTGIVASQKFVPVQFEEGGIVQGRSHREGGVPFTVQGVGGYEMEGGEYIVNKKATAKYLPMLEQINSYGKINNSMFKHYANGGLTGMEAGMGMGESTRINAMLLQRLNQPIRAYVSERELMTKSNERINQKMKSRL